MNASRIEPREIRGSPSDYDALLDRIGDKHLVLIGEASHGTHEFYRERGLLTRRLIEERGFAAVAVEADWPDAYRVNRYLHGATDDADAEEALRGFRRFPTWMWRNAEVLDFVGWTRAHNERAGEAGRVSFFGLDIYSLFASIAAVIAYLEKVDPAAAVRARERYACLEEFGGEQAYGRVAALGVGDLCRRGAVAQLLELQRNGDAYLRRDGVAAEDEQFCAEQNARVVTGAEQYYRSMFDAPGATWNLRDRHMADTLDRLAAHLSRHGRAPKIVVWEHNSHIGDARMTEMGERGELNIGQLTRERHPEDALDLTTPAAKEALSGPRLERAIGVIYRPRTERQSHYFLADLASQFDAVIHLDETRAVEPLERTAGWETGEPAETFPTAL